MHPRMSDNDCMKARLWHGLWSWRDVQANPGSTTYELCGNRQPIEFHLQIRNYVFK